MTSLLYKLELNHSFFLLLARICTTLDRGFDGPLMLIYTVSLVLNSAIIGLALKLRQPNQEKKTKMPINWSEIKQTLTNAVQSRPQDKVLQNLIYTWMKAMPTPMPANTPVLCFTCSDSTGTHSTVYSLSSASSLLIILTPHPTVYSLQQLSGTLVPLLNVVLAQSV